MRYELLDTGPFIRSRNITPASLHSSWKLLQPALYLFITLCLHLTSGLSINGMV